MFRNKPDKNRLGNMPVEDQLHLSLSSPCNPNCVVWIITLKFCDPRGYLAYVLVNRGAPSNDTSASTCAAPHHNLLHKFSCHLERCNGGRKLFLPLRCRINLGSFGCLFGSPFEGFAHKLLNFCCIYLITFVDCIIKEKFNI